MSKTHGKQRERERERGSNLIDCSTVSPFFSFVVGTFQRKNISKPSFLFPSIPNSLSFPCWPSSSNARVCRGVLSHGTGKLTWKGTLYRLPCAAGQCNWDCQIRATAPLLFHLLFPFVKSSTWNWQEYSTRAERERETRRGNEQPPPVVIIMRITLNSIRQLDILIPIRYSLCNKSHVYGR